MSFIGLYAGHFLFHKSPDSAKVISLPPVQYKHISMEFNGNMQEIDTLEVDLSSGRAKIKPVLSYDSVFGFEKLSVMALRSRAYAAVNAGFFYEYGLPVGMVVIDGKLIINSTGKYPVLAIGEKKASLAQLNTKMWLEDGDEKLEVNSINVPGNPGGVALYTHAYGTDNRAKTKNITVTIENNIVKKTDVYMGEVDIPEDGMLLTLFEPLKFDLNSLPIKEGDRVEFHYEPDLGSDAQAYECGSWVVKDGKVVIGERDEWVGVMTNRDPRTAVGIKANGNVLLVTVDGRQPGYSAGFTGKELGEFLLSCGVRDAAMLDGGASTEMILNNKIVNRPSFKGQERMLGGGLIVEYEK